MKKSLQDIVSPIPIYGPAKDCVELIIYDNDGPEGLFRRFRFSRSSEAIKLVFDCFEESDLEGTNFELVNHWKYPHDETTA